MRRYAYKALDANGSAVEGEIEASTEKEVEAHFLKSKLTPLRIQPLKDKNDNWRNRYRARRKRKLLENELIAFTRQFAAAYGAGIPVGRAIDLLAAQTPHEQFKACLVEISRKVQDGLGLTEAFQQFPQFFDATYVSILNSGEVSGNLDLVLNYSANLLERKLIHKERLRSTLLYPKLVIGMIAITSVVVVIFVIPQFAKLYEKFETPLPLPTLLMVKLSNIVTTYWWVVPVFIPLATALVRYLKTNKEFMLWFHEKAVNLPIFGKTILKIELTQFSTTFALLLRSGIKITDAATIAINSMKNTFLKQQLLTIIPIVEAGGTLAEALGKIPAVPPLMSSMIAIGEDSGTLETLLDRVAALYDHETELMMKKLPTLLEPIVLSFLFVLVFFLALAVYLPMWKMASLIRR